jgi:hypothetical protein
MKPGDVVGVKDGDMVLYTLNPGDLIRCEPFKFEYNPEKGFQAFCWDVHGQEKVGMEPIRVQHPWPEWIGLVVEQSLGGGENQ